MRAHVTWQPAGLLQRVPAIDVRSRIRRWLPRRLKRVSAAGGRGYVGRKLARRLDGVAKVQGAKLPWLLGRGSVRDQCKHCCHD